MLGNKDTAPFAVSGTPITNNTTYTGSSIPGQVEIYDSLTNPFINGIIILNDSGGYNLFIQPNSEPDRVLLGQWTQVNTFGLLNSNVRYGDSAYSVIWEN